MNHIRTCTGSGPTEKPKQQRSEYSLVPLLWLASETLKEEEKKYVFGKSWDRIRWLSHHFHTSIKQLKETK